MGDAEETPVGDEKKLLHECQVEYQIPEYSPQEQVSSTPTTEIWQTGRVFIKSKTAKEIVLILGRLPLHYNGCEITIPKTLITASSDGKKWIATGTFKAKFCEAKEFGNIEFESDPRTLAVERCQRKVNRKRYLHCAFISGLYSTIQGNAVEGKVAPPMDLLTDKGFELHLKHNAKGVPPMKAQLQGPLFPTCSSIWFSRMDSTQTTWNHEKHADYVYLGSDS